MTGNRQPVVNRGANPPPFEARLAASFMARNEEQNPVARRDRSLQRMVDRFPGAVEAVAVEVERPVRVNSPGPKAPIPAAIQRGVAMGWLGSDG